MSDEVKSTRRATSANTPYNAMSYMVENMINAKVNTAIPVRVDAVRPGKTGAVGRLDATPLVAQRDAFGSTLAPQRMYDLPYARIQGGKAALILDPTPGDIGIAVFAQQDISLVGGEGNSPVQSGSFRSFDMADGMYIGGILNGSPDIWLELTQEGTATLHAPVKIILDAPLTEITGLLRQGTGTGAGGTATFNGSIRTSGDQVAGTVSLQQHIHGGVDTGNGYTRSPNT